MDMGIPIMKKKSADARLTDYSTNQRVVTVQAFSVASTYTIYQLIAMIK